MRVPLRFSSRIVAVVAVLAAVLTAWGVLRGDLRSTGDTPPPATPTAASPTTTAPATSPVAGGARGCLGGENAEAAALVAQREAPLTPTGAAELAATIARWTWIYPRTKPLEMDGAMLWAPEAGADAARPQWPNASNGDSAYASFINGHYLIESTTADTVVVSIQYTSVYSPASGQMKSEYATIETILRAVDGHWRLSSVRRHRHAPEVIAQGQLYRQGC